MKSIILFSGAVVLLFTGCGIKPHPLYHSRNVTVKQSPGGEADTPSASIKVEDENIYLKEINAYKGVPYKYGGINKKGIDCSGLVKNVFQKVQGINLPHNAEKQFEYGKPISKRNLALGDLVFFSVAHGKIDHVGIFIHEDTFAHASVSKGVIISSLNEKYYKKRYRGAVRIIEK